MVRCPAAVGPVERVKVTDGRQPRVPGREAAYRPHPPVWCRTRWAVRPLPLSEKVPLPCSVNVARNREHHAEAGEVRTTAAPGTGGRPAHLPPAESIPEIP